MNSSCKLIFAATALAVAFFDFACSLQAQQADFATTVIATHPIAYYRLDSTSGKSQVGASTYSANGGVGIGLPGSGIAGASNKFIHLDGQSGYLLTTQKGGVGQSASIMAWVNLSDLPSKIGHFFYVAGESENGNDLDLQFETDNQLKFFTAAGGHLTYIPAPASLLNQWHMILATMDLASRTRALYWDGKLVAHDAGGGEAGKKAPFSIGASTVFSGRFFKGGVAETALWDHALTAAQVTSIYAAANVTASGAGAVSVSAGSSTGGGANTPTTGPFASKATLDVNDAKGPLKLKREEQIAYMFLSAIEEIEHNCQLTFQHVCSMDQMLTDSYPAGSGVEHLKFDPNKTDPNYTYTVASNGMAWEAHANAKKPGLIGFCFMARTVGTTTATYSAAGRAGWVDTELTNRGMSGDSFASQ
jgi:hypothetical protein